MYFFNLKPLICAVVFELQLEILKLANFKFLMSNLT